MEKSNESAPQKRKQYQAPAIVVREPLEAVAIACTDPTAKGDPLNCPIGNDS